MKKKCVINCLIIAITTILIVGIVIFLKNYCWEKDDDCYIVGNNSGNIVNAGLVAETSNDIFIASNSGNKVGIYRKSKNDGKIERISNDKALYLNISEDDLYYVNLTENGKIYKMEFDGQDKESVLNLENCEFFTYTDEGSFFEYPGETKIYSPYSIDDDFENEKKLNDDDSENLVFQNGYLYYSNWNDNGKIYRMKCDGSEKIALNNNYSSYINVSGDWIYYTKAIN